MSNREILAEAYRRYPIGTKFKSIFDDKPAIWRTIRPYESFWSPHDTVEFRVEERGNVRCDNGIWTGDGGVSNPLIRKNGVWAPTEVGVVRDIMAKYENL